MRKSRTAGIIATFNHENYALSAAQSLAAQVDQLIVVDDGSLDGTVNILKRANLPNMTLITHSENLGVSTSYNEGVAASNADILVFQGGDDISLSERTEAHVLALNEKKCILHFSQPNVIDALGSRLPDFVAEEFFHDVTSSEFSHKLFFSGNFICGPSVAMRKSDFESLGGFNKGLAYLQDFDLWLRASGTGEIQMSQSRLVEYRKHNSNLSRDAPGKSIEYRARFDAEMDFILGNALNTFNLEALIVLGEKAGFSQEVLCSGDDEVLRMLLRLSHPNVSQIRRGLYDLFELLGKRTHWQMLSRLGIDNAAINELSMKADVLNVADRLMNFFRRSNFVGK